MSIDFLPNTAGPVQRSMAANYAERRARLFNAPAPKRVVRIPPPLSPFNPQRVAAEAALLEEEQSAEWGNYPPFVNYDEYIPPPKPARKPASRQTARQILSEVCAKHRVDYQELIGDTRPRRITNARAEAYYRLRDERQLSWNQIGKLMGGKDHTTVYHGYQKHLERLMLARAAA